jgi:hypothetical protein
VRRLDQGIGEIAKLTFVFGKLEVRRLEADACRGFGTQPTVHVVVAHIRASAPEIAAAAAAEHRTCHEQHQSRE